MELFLAKSPQGILIIKADTGMFSERISEKREGVGIQEHL